MTLARLKGTVDEGGEGWVRLTANLALWEAQLHSAKQRILEEAASVDEAAARHLEFDIQLRNTSSSLGTLGIQAQVARDGLDAMGNRLPWLSGQLAALEAQSDATRSALAGIASAATRALQSAASAAVGIMDTTEIASIYSENTKRINEQIKVMHEVG